MKFSLFVDVDVDRFTFFSWEMWSETSHIHTHTFSHFGPSFFLFKTNKCKNNVKTYLSFDRNNKPDSIKYALFCLFDSNYFEMRRNLIEFDDAFERTTNFETLWCCNKGSQQHHFFDWIVVQETIANRSYECITGSSCVDYFLSSQRVSAAMKSNISERGGFSSFSQRRRCRCRRRRRRRKFKESDNVLRCIICFWN